MSRSQMDVNFGNGRKVCVEFDCGDFEISFWLDSTYGGCATTTDPADLALLAEALTKTVEFAALSG